MTQSIVNKNSENISFYCSTMLVVGSNINFNSYCYL